MKADGCVKKCLLLVFLTLLQSVGAAEVLRLSLDNIVERALENNLRLQRDLIDLSSAGYQAEHLWAQVFPTVSATASTRHSSKLFAGDGFELSKDGVRYSAGLGISFSPNAGTAYAIKNIQLAYQGRLLSYEDACNQLEIQITKSFYALIADRENLHLLEVTQELARQQLEKNQTGFDNGIVSELTVTQSRLAWENARYDYSAAEGAFENRLRDFLAPLGIGQDTEVELEGEIEIAQVETNADTLIQQYLPGRPNIVSLRREIERLENAEKQAVLSNRAPSITLSLQWQSSNFDPFDDSLEGSAAIRIPVDAWIPGTRGAQTVRNAKLDIDKAKIDLKIAEDAAMADIRSYAANARNAWESVGLAQQCVQIAERSYELTEEGFRIGAVESLVLENARNSLASARQNLLRSELACQIAILDLSAALNVKWKEFIK